MNIELTENELAVLRRILDKANEPKAEELKYKPGDIVLMPVRVVEVHPEFSENNPFDYPYQVEPLGNPADRTGMTRAALEPPAPQVGQRVIAWKYCTAGKFKRLDAIDPVYKYRVVDDFEACGRFSHAVAIE